MSNTGTITHVLGAVVDAKFDAANVPGIYNALEVTFPVSGKTVSLTLEVQQHLGDGLVRAVAMSATEGLDLAAPPSPIRARRFPCPSATASSAASSTSPASRLTKRARSPSKRSTRFIVRRPCS